MASRILTPGDLGMAPSESGLVVVSDVDVALDPNVSAATLTGEMSRLRARFEERVSAPLLDTAPLSGGGELITDPVGEFVRMLRVHLQRLGVAESPEFLQALLAFWTRTQGSDMLADHSTLAESQARLGSGSGAARLNTAIQVGDRGVCLAVGLGTSASKRLHTPDVFRTRALGLAQLGYRTAMTVADSMGSVDLLGAPISSLADNLLGVARVVASIHREGVKNARLAGDRRYLVAEIS
jgi:hypothetical protein